MSTLKTASVLAFERSFDISDAVFFQRDSSKPDEKAIIVPVTKKRVRGTISNRLKKASASDPAKLDAEIRNANLRKLDVAILDHDKDTLVVEWSCKVLPFTGEPCVCVCKDHSQAYKQKLVDTVKGYLQETGLSALAKRYAANMVNARWLWRNRMGAEQIKITITYRENNADKHIIIDNAKAFSLNDFDSVNDKVEQLSQLISKGLQGEQFIILYVRGEAKVGYGQEVYPSQELILEEKDKVLYQINSQAGMHSQKISNAIRTIDTWYQENSLFPIAIEPYGAVTTLGMAFRHPKQRQDFYSHFDGWVLNDEKPTLEQQHYVMGVLIRGGVFGDVGKE